MKDQNIVASGGLLIAGHADLWQAWTSLTLRLLLLEILELRSLSLLLGGRSDLQQANVQPVLQSAA